MKRIFFMSMLMLFTAATVWADDCDPETTYEATVQFSLKPLPPVGGLPGLFTVNASGKQVLFSKGNLQFRAADGNPNHLQHKTADGFAQGEWRFAEHQYDFVGDATYGNVSGSNNASIGNLYTGWIDLFGFGTSGCTISDNTYNPWLTSTTSNNETTPYIRNHINNTNNDWGVYNAISNGGNTPGLWRTLTKDEWAYIWATRDYASSKRGAATVAGVFGVILLPDVFNMPTEITQSFRPIAALKESYGQYMNETTLATDNVYTAEQWVYMEAAGAIFLPATGYRNGTSVSGYTQSNRTYMRCDYWTATYKGSDSGYYRSYIAAFNLESALANYCYFTVPYFSNISTGNAVRLVTEPKEE